jgi:hypothetical protein
LEQASTITVSSPTFDFAGARKQPQVGQNSMQKSPFPLSLINFIRKG